MMHVNSGLFDVLFASPLQPSERPTAEAVAEAIGSTVLRLGVPGCTSHTAEEFGDHQQEAAERMRWVRQLVSDLCCRLYLPTLPTPSVWAGTDLLPVRMAA